MENSQREAAPDAAPTTANDILRFIIPSTIGFFLFLFPIEYDGKITIALGVLVDKLRLDVIGPQTMAHLCTLIFVAGALLSAAFTLGPEKLKRRFPYLYSVFDTTPVWLALRLLAGVAAPMTLFGCGPDWVIGTQTGGTAYIEVAGLIFPIIGLACLLLPFLTDFGFLELVGTLMRRPFKRLFNLPGRATIDTLASWVGASSVAVLVTSRQYEAGFYSAREAAMISTNFSVVSIPFVVLTAQIAGIPEYFVQLYAAMVGIGIICAVITPRLRPLSAIPDTYHEPVGAQIQEEVAEGRSRFHWAIEKALERARESPRVRETSKRSLHSVFDLFCTMMPAAMSIEFLCLVIYHHTLFFQTITLPAIPVLGLLQIPEAAAAAPGLVVGLLDQFVPAVIASGIDDKMTSFLLAGLSVTQLIFFAETAILILRSHIPLTLRQLVTIFCIRTLIAVPLLALVAHLVI